MVLPQIVFTYKFFCLFELNSIIYTNPSIEHIRSPQPFPTFKLEILQML